jgi:hypothetical protein
VSGDVEVYVVEVAVDAAGGHRVRRVLARERGAGPERDAEPEPESDPRPGPVTPGLSPWACHLHPSPGPVTWACHLCLFIRVVGG